MAGPRSLMALAALLLLGAGEAAAKKRVLMLLPDAAEKAKYSSYIGQLSNYGYQVDVKGVRDSTLKLKEYDTWLYEHLILMAPKAESFGGGLELSGVLEFIDAGNNVLLAVSSEVSDMMATLAAEVGVELDDKGTKVFDHFSHAVINGAPDHSAVATTDLVQSSAMLGDGTKLPVLFRGVAAKVPADAELVSVAVSAPETAYSADPRKALPEAPLAGSGIALMAFMQARNNARVVVCGSVDLFGDEFFNAEVVVPAMGSAATKTGNKDVAAMASRWLFKARGVLVAENMRHRIIGGAENPPLYRVNDDVEFSIDLFEISNGKKPWTKQDVQVEFTMLDPHVRLPLTHDGQGHFSVRFKVPDVYGVFKYVLDYRHQGYSYVQLVQQVPVRPFKHNEYERFVVCAYPYYAAALSTMAAFFAFSFLFLYHKGDK